MATAKASITGIIVVAESTYNPSQPATPKVSIKPPKVEIKGAVTPCHYIVASNITIKDIASAIITIRFMSCPINFIFCWLTKGFRVALGFREE